MAQSNTNLSALQRRRWSSEEDILLKEQVNKCRDGPNVDWRKVSLLLEGRNNKDCRKRWLKIDMTWRSGQWSRAEDEQLTRAVAMYGARWKAVSDEMEPRTRNPDQCAKRWRNALDPELIRGKWTHADDVLLERAIQELGGRYWKDIVPQYFPGRSRLDLSNRFTMLQRRKRIQHSRSTLNATNITIAPDRSTPASVCTSSDAGSPDASNLSPLTEPNDDPLPPAVDVNWNTGLGHPYSDIDEDMPSIGDTGLRPELHNSQSACYDTPVIKVENWSTPSTISSGQISPTSQHPDNAEVHAYNQYSPWHEAWPDSKSDTAGEAALSFDAYAPLDNFQISSHTNITTPETIGQNSSQQCTLALDLRNEVDSAYLDALRKDVGPLTIQVTIPLHERQALH